MARFDRLLAALMCLALAPCAWGCSAGSSIPVDGGEAGSAPEEVAAESLSADSRVVALSNEAATQWLLAGGSLVGASDEAATAGDLSPDVTMLGASEAIVVDDLMALDPELVVTSEGVAVSASVLSALESAGVPVMDLTVHALADYEQNMASLVELTGNDELYEHSVTEVVERANEVIEHAPEGREGSFAVLRVTSDELSLEGAESYISATVSDLGLTNAVSQARTVDADKSAEAIAELDPDWLFVVYGQEGKAAQEAFAALTADASWKGLEVASKGKVVVLPQELFGHAPCARWGEAYAYLSQVLHGAWA